MSHYDSHPAGNFCWVELATSDVAAARAFYSEIFGWTYQEMDAGHFTYTVATIEGRGAAGLYKLLPEMQGVPPHWLSYVCTDSADKTTVAATDRGAKALWGPQDIRDVGRMTVLQDPQGAVLGIWQPGAHKGAGILGVHGTMTWHELMTPDAAAAKEFYSGIFGWTTSEMPMPSGAYTMFINGQKMVGGCMPLGPEMQGVPPNWLLYFDVDDCDAAHGKAASLGAKTICPPTDIPGVGRFTILMDPQGAAFAMIKLNR